MDYKDLANLIFPNAKPISYYEEKYSKRDLPEGAIVTRFAPSPTGFVHVGGLMQCVINRQLTNQTKGVFLLRIEDTDQKREIEDGVAQIVNAIKDFGIEFDEGMLNETEEKGSYGPYKQSVRGEIYQAYAKWLIEQGRAYPCFATSEELEEMRKKQEAAKLRTGYYGVWATYRNLSVEEAAEKIKAGTPYIVRFKSMGREDRKIRHHDVIKGNIDFPENDQDIVIIKADGLPTYHFAHAVDDHLMRVTHVIRSDEWVSSLPLHLELFKTLEFETPKYCHYAPILKEEDGKKRKISKRKDPEAAVSYYHEEGIPAQSVCEYLMNIGNSSFEMWRKNNPNTPMSEFTFDISKMSVSGAIFDIVKLLDVSKNVISKYTKEDIYNEVLEWAKRYDKELEDLLQDKEYALKIFGIERGNAKPRKDIAKWSEVKEAISYMYDDKFLNNTSEFEYGKISDKEEIKKILSTYLEKYFDINDDKQTWFDKMKDLSEELGYAREVKEFKQNPEKWPGHVGDISTVLRVSLTGRMQTPDLYEIMQVLGKESVEKRITKITER
ncbi:MAG: glutamate--tRNA ligase [Clostridia bacterium]|nr:glutamate--tRNA ligase [Clostridia bacterium]MCI9413157.1 glutamate--tRNA ligase [Clostridia bacterium]